VTLEIVRHASRARLGVAVERVGAHIRVTRACSFKKRPSSTASWSHDRHLQFRLPLYALNLEVNISGLDGVLRNPRALFWTTYLAGAMVLSAKALSPLGKRISSPRLSVCENSCDEAARVATSRQLRSAMR